MPNLFRQLTGQVARYVGALRDLLNGVPEQVRHGVFLTRTFIIRTSAHQKSAHSISLAAPKPPPAYTYL